VSWWLFRVMRRPEKLPDLLREATGAYFEQNGICFAPKFEVIERQCFLNIYFQNRYARQATTRVDMLPPLRTLWFTRHDLPRVSVNFECPGGAFGVVRIPYSFPARYQGKRMALEIGADTKYPFYHGDLLRLRTGIRVSSTHEMGQGHQLVTTILFGAILGALVTSRMARVALNLPRDVNDEPPPKAAPMVEILWRLPQTDANVAPPPPDRIAA
jgi:hypothetical protein